MKTVILFLIATLTGVGATPFRVRDIDAPFLDGLQLRSDFPSDNGAVPTTWVHREGWSGIQEGSSGTRCDAGSYCSYGSYACPARYQKSQ
jgi:hypothetical protein